MACAGSMGVVRACGDTDEVVVGCGDRVLVPQDLSFAKELEEGNRC